MPNTKLHARRIREFGMKKKLLKLKLVRNVDACWSAFMLGKIF